jgi:hypothetical protein
MANAFRWRYGETNPVTVAVDADTAIEIGDLLWLDGDDAKPFSDLSYAGVLATGQADAHDKFLGVAMQASPAGASGEIRVATSGVFEFDQAAATVELGARVGATDDGGGVEIQSQRVIAVAADAPEQALGRCARRATAATRLLVAIHSTVMNDGPQAVA